MYSGVNSRVAANASWPSQWRGGRTFPVYKKKGAPEDCNSYRGILLADHAGKALTGQVKAAIDSTYVASIPLTQYGAVPQRGADFASHVIRLIISTATARGHSVMALFF